MNAEAQMCVVPVPAILLGVAGDSIGAVFFTCQFSRAAEERRGRNGVGERANERAVGTREGGREGGRRRCCGPSRQQFFPFCAMTDGGADGRASVGGADERATATATPTQ